MNFQIFSKAKERGQSMVEYATLLPPILLISFIVLVPLAEHANYIFCRMVYVMDPSEDKCDEWLERGGFDPETGQQNSDGSSYGEDECISMVYGSGSSICDTNPDCNTTAGLNSGIYWSDEDVESFVINAGQEYHIYESGYTDDGCYLVNIHLNRVEWQKVGTHEGCLDIDHTQVWNVPVCSEIEDEPTAEPTEEPTAEPTEEPTAEPTEDPGPEPTEEPTAEPTEEPTAEPTEEPTAEPTEEPTAEPTEEPTAEPTEEPTAEPTEVCVPWDNNDSLCEDNPDFCAYLPGLNYGTYWLSNPAYKIVLKTNKGYTVYSPGYTNDGCFIVNLTDSEVTWWRIGRRSKCGTVRSVQVWMLDFCD